jgi:hypothetical protein
MPRSRSKKLGFSQQLSQQLLQQLDTLPQHAWAGAQQVLGQQVGAGAQHDLVGAQQEVEQQLSQQESQQLLFRLNKPRQKSRKPPDLPPQQSQPQLSLTEPQQPPHDE